jgi:hypothetical protein
VIENLKNRGWVFGCNNYTYSTAPNSLNEIEFTKDLSLWQKEIQPITQPTPYYLSNEVEPHNTTKINALLDNGFSILFFEDEKTQFNINNSFITITYKNINGTTLRNNSENLQSLFDCNNVYDHNARFIPFNTTLT